MRRGVVEVGIPECNWPRQRDSPFHLPVPVFNTHSSFIQSNIHRNIQTSKYNSHTRAHTHTNTKWMDKEEEGEKYRWLLKCRCPVSSVKLPPRPPHYLLSPRHINRTLTSPVECSDSRWHSMASSPSLVDKASSIIEVIIITFKILFWHFFLYVKPFCFHFRVHSPLILYLCVYVCVFTLWMVLVQPRSPLWQNCWHDYHQFSLTHETRTVRENRLQAFKLHGSAPS